MTRFFSLFDISGKLYQTFQTTFNISHTFEPVDCPWMTVSLKDQDASVIAVLQGDGNPSHPGRIRSGGLPPQERRRTVKPRYEATILKEQTSAANITSTPVLGGRILSDIANFDVDSPVTPSGSDLDAYGEGDDESYYSWESSEALSELQRSILDMKQDVTLHVPAADGQIYHTALGVPPLHHKGVVRSKVLHVPEYSPGTCPVHGCAPCMTCESRDKPLLFSI